jgi:hypothetical protein
MSVPSASNAKYNWLMNGKTIDNVNEALAPTSDITSANITYLRENFTLGLGKHYTEENVIPIVDAEYGYSLHIITCPGEGENWANPHSEVRYILTESGTEAPRKVRLDDGYIVKSTGCVFDSNTTSSTFRILAISSEKDNEDGTVISKLHFYKVSEFMTGSGLVPAFIPAIELTNSLISGANAHTGPSTSTLHFSTQLVPIDSSKIPCLKKTGLSDASKTAGVKKALLVGVSPRQKWNLDMRNTQNNDIPLVNGAINVPLGANDVAYTDLQVRAVVGAGATDYKGLVWSTTELEYKQGTGTAVSKGVYMSSGGKTVVTKTTLYDYINNPIKNDEYGHLLCLDITVNDPPSGTGPAYSNLGDRIWSIRTAPIASSKTVTSGDCCDDCEDEPDCHVFDEKYLLSKEILWDGVNGNDAGNANAAPALKKQTHVLITNVMKPGNVAVSFDKECKNANECRIIAAADSTTGDGTYVAWIREFVLADKNVTYSSNTTGISLFAPTIIATPGAAGGASSFVNAGGSGNISGVEVVDQTIITYQRADGEYIYSGKDTARALVFAKLSDVVPMWTVGTAGAEIMGGQGAGRRNANDRLNTPFDESFVLKGDVTVTSTKLNTANTGTPINVRITDKFSSGLFVFCYVGKNDELSATELNALNYRGAGVKGMPVIDIDDASVKFGTGRFTHMPMDQVFLENAERLREVRSVRPERNYCFNALRYCLRGGAEAAVIVGAVNAVASGSTGCNVDNLVLNRMYQADTLTSVFTAAAAALVADNATAAVSGTTAGSRDADYTINRAAHSVYAQQFYYNSICSAKLYQKLAKYASPLEADIDLEQEPSSGNRIRIWNALSASGRLLAADVAGARLYQQFILDSDTAGATDRKRINVRSILNRVVLTYPEYHEITSGAHIHYNIANKCGVAIKPTNYVSVFTKGGCVAFYDSANLTTAKATFMCSVPLIEETTVGSASIGSGGMGGVKFGTVADQFFLYALCPNLADLTLQPIDGIGALATNTAPQAYIFTESYIIAYDLNAISAPPAAVANAATTSITGTNPYAALTLGYITAYLADTGKQYLAGTLTAANNLLIVPTGSYSHSNVVRLFRKTDIARSNAAVTALDTENGMIWAPTFDLLPVFQLPFTARSVTGVTVSANNVFVQGGISNLTKANFKNSVTTSTYSQSVRVFSLDL